jgi:hypothetical protein
MQGQVLHTRSAQRPSLFALIVNEKTHDHCLDIIAAMANQQLAEGPRFGVYPGDYFAILDQLKIQKLISHIRLLFAWVLGRWTHLATDYRPPAFEDVLPNRA